MPRHSGVTDTITIEARFRGPPHSGNGGYVAGLLAHHAGGHRAVMMRAPAPLDAPLQLHGETEPVCLRHGDTLVAEAALADPATLPIVPPAPTLLAARAAGERAVSYHPICFCCGDRVAPGEGLNVQTGQLADAPKGHVAGIWTVEPSLCDPDGRASEEHVWAAIDCPGFYAWVAFEGRHGALTGTMQAAVLEWPGAGEACIVLAWPLQQLSERRRTAGVALFGADRRLMARGVQTWIKMMPR